MPDRVVEEEESAGLSAQQQQLVRRSFGVDFRWAVCRIECAEHATGELCRECHSTGLY